MTIISPIAPAASADATPLMSKRRAAIDLFAITRAKTIRAALCATNLFRPHPTQAEDKATRDAWRAVLTDVHADMVRACHLLNGHDPVDLIDPDIAAWIGDHGMRHPRVVKAFEHTRDLTHALVTAAAREDARALESALAAHEANCQSGFFETVTQFCDTLWAELDDHRNTEVAKADATAAMITKTLKRLEHIGKHVRLVSLNASVEAARVGDAGRGLGVIAVEFKTLAEEIQHLATTARNNVTAMDNTKGGAHTNGVSNQR